MHDPTHRVKMKLFIIRSFICVPMYARIYQIYGYIIGSPGIKPKATKFLNSAGSCYSAIKDEKLANSKFSDIFLVT